MLENTGVSSKRAESCLFTTMANRTCALELCDSRCMFRKARPIEPQKGLLGKYAEGFPRTTYCLPVQPGGFLEALFWLVVTCFGLCVMEKRDMHKWVHQIGHCRKWSAVLVGPVVWLFGRWSCFWWVGEQRLNVLVRIWGGRGSPVPRKVKRSSA